MISPHYQEKLGGLNVSRSSGHPKPHKVCLLLAVLDLVQDGGKIDNHFTLEELEPGFSAHFQKLKKGNDAENINLPFFHLLGDGIWHYTLRPGMQAVFDAQKSSGQSPGTKWLHDVVDYAYLDDELFVYFSSPECRAKIRELLLENLEDLSVQFHRWLIGLGKSEKTADSYVGAIRGSISNWAAEAGISRQNLIGMTSYTKFIGVAEKLADYRAFIEHNARGKQMYSAALNSYKIFLADSCQVQVADDISGIINDQDIDSTQKAMLVNARIGQGQFREKLIRYWQGCALTGYQSLPFLVASHIKPWRDSNATERLDVYNGILLLPNLDKAFDLGCITFEDSGVIRVSDAIEERETLGITTDMKIDLEPPHLDYMAYHRELVFEKRE